MYIEYKQNNTKKICRVEVLLHVKFNLVETYLDNSLFSPIFIYLST